MLHNGVLKGVNCPDHRATLIQLNSEGWKINRSSGGHLKLTHKDANKPVFASMTPSDHRAKYNLVSQCRKAITLSRGNRDQASGEIAMSEQDISNAFAKSKMSKKSRKRQVLFDRHNPAGVVSNANEAMDRMRGKASTSKNTTLIPDSAVLSTSSRPMSKDQALRAAEALFSPQKSIQEQRDQSSATAAAPATDAIVASVSAPCEKQKPTELKAETTDTPEVAAEVVQKPKAKRKKAITKTSNTKKTKVSTQKTKDKTMEATAIDTKNAEAVNIVPAKSADEAAPAGLTIVSDDVLALARKIASGKYQQINITSDMVGKTLLLDGEAFLTGSMAAEVPTKATPTASATAHEVKINTTGKTSETKSRGEVISEKLLATIKTFNPEPVSQKDLAELHAADFGYKSLNSARASISRHLTKMVQDGILTESEIKRMRHFTLA